MAVDFEKIRATADRVAASHGLDVVEVDFASGSKNRALQVFLEKNAEGRAKLKAQIEAGETGDLPERYTSGAVDLDQLSGVTHEDCEAFSRDFGTVLDVEDLIPGDEYTLEVSSPGLDRKLSRKEDFLRFRGNLAKVETTGAIEGNRHWQGKITEVGETTVTLDLTATKQKGKAKKVKAQVVTIEMSNIAKARLVPEI